MVEIRATGPGLAAGRSHVRGGYIIQDLTPGEWRIDAAAPGGRREVVALTCDTGYLWFFNPANVEAVIKVLDACALNQRFWVFAGGLTDVNTVIRVTDTKTGTSKMYTNPLGRAFLPVQDTSAFQTCP